MNADPPLIVPVRDLLTTARHESVEDDCATSSAAYRDTLRARPAGPADQYRLVDMARKVVGVGSVGTRSWMVLLLGATTATPVPAGEGGRTVGAGGVSRPRRVRQPRRTGRHGPAADADGQRHLPRLEPHAGIDGQERDFYIRQLRDWKGSVEVEEMQPQGLRAVRELCGWTLARAHARTGDRIAIASYLGASTAFDRAMARFADAYADLNERDHSHWERGRHRPG